MSLSVTARVGDKALKGLLKSANEQIVAFCLSVLALVVLIARHRLSIQLMKENAWETFLPWIWILCALIAWHICKGAVEVYKEEQKAMENAPAIVITDKFERRTTYIPPKSFRMKLYAAVLFYLSLPVMSAYLSWDKASVRTKNPTDTSYTPPKGPGIRVEGHIPIPSSQLCVGLSEADELGCLCPRPLKYSLKSLNAPTDNNYATELTVDAVREPIYRLRVFTRTFISYGALTETSPHAKDAASFLVMMESDKYSFIMHSSGPQNRYRAELHTAEGLRIKCVNQEN